MIKRWSHVLKAVAVLLATSQLVACNPQTPPEPEVPVTTPTQVGGIEGRTTEVVDSVPVTTETTTTTESTASTTTQNLTDAIATVNWDEIPQEDPLKLMLNRSQGAFVVDLSSGEKLLWHEKEQVLPASISKLMTLLYASELIGPDEVILVGDETKMIAESSSMAFISSGMKLKMSMIAEGMMLASGNDAAYAMAAAGGRRLRGVEDLEKAGEGDAKTAEKDVEHFIEEMGKWAKEQGFKNSTWITPDGYRAEGQSSSLDDLVRLGELASQSNFILHITSEATTNAVYESGESMTWNNGNQMINPTSEYFREGIIGLKTGSFFDYNNILVLEEAKDGRQRLIGVFGLPDSKSRYELTTALFDDVHSASEE